MPGSPPTLFSPFTLTALPGFLRVHSFTLFVLATITVALAVGQLLWGSVPLGPREVWEALTGNPTSEAVRYIVIDYRLPRLLTAALAGAALGLGGLIMQSVFNNPLADPSLLGINAGAALGAATITLWSGNVGGLLLIVGSVRATTVLFAGIGALFVLAVIGMMARRMQSRAALLVAGVMVSFLATALLSLMAYQASADGLRLLQHWTLGDFSAVAWSELPFFAIALCCPVGFCFYRSRELDALLLGTTYARSLGVDAHRNRGLLLVAVGWMCAIVTAWCGPIAFIGLSAPHAARQWAHTALHRRLIPLTLWMGAAMALLCQTLCTLPGMTETLPINVITPLIGAPVVIALLLTRTA